MIKNKISEEWRTEPDDKIINITLGELRKVILEEKKVIKKLIDEKLDLIACCLDDLSKEIKELYNVIMEDEKQNK